MKQLIAGVVIIVVVGLGGFLYRNIMERSAIPQPDGIACTMEARICPNGSAVGREGPNCEFSACPVPNIDIQELRVVFLPPPGYTQVEAGTSFQETQRIFEKPSLSENAPHLITLKRYEIPEGQTAEQVLVANVRRQPADMPIESTGELGTTVLGNNTYRSFVVERFEGQVESAYFLIRERDILVFSVLERDVLNWTEPSLSVDTLPEHAALRQMLTTLATY